MDNKKTNRSTAYQYLFLETAYSNDMMESFCNEDSIQGRLNPYHYDEELLNLEDELKVEFWRVVESCLTDRQRDVIKLYVDGYTQMEIAKILNVNQSSITKNLNGNTSYTNQKTSYGGSKKKIKKIIENDEKIKSILARMNARREEKW